MRGQASAPNLSSINKYAHGGATRPEAPRGISCYNPGHVWLNLSSVRRSPVENQY
jgi:hypothetical protein